MYTCSLVACDHTLFLVLYTHTHVYSSVFLQYENLDQEHKGLFDGVFACAGARGDKGKFDFLFGKVKAHFATEEVSMIRAYLAHVL